MIDIKASLTEDGSFTIGFTDGDLAKEDGFDTAINLSLFTDKRASEDRISDPSKRRGWLGNVASPVEGRQLGSLLWLINQRKLIPETRNDAISYCTDALNWIVEDGFAKSVTTTGEIIPRLGIELKITIVPNTGDELVYYRRLWELTGNAS